MSDSCRRTVSIVTQLTIPERGSCHLLDCQGPVQLPRGQSLRPPKAEAGLSLGQLQPDPYPRTWWPGLS
jgi:hypothetical protein